MSGHSFLNPSSAHRWMVCPGSVPLSQGLEDKGSVYAEEGTRAHELAAAMLLGKDKLPPADNDEMTEFVQVYVDAIRNAAEGKMLFIEERVSPANLIGSNDSDGTADAVILDMENSIIEVHDLKYGKGHMVEAEDNPQPMLYGLGAMCSFDYLLEAERFKLVIHQPRRDHISEAWYTREQLLQFAENVRSAAQRVSKAMSANCLDDFLHPSDEACLWCRAKATCPALGGFVSKTVLDDFDVVKDVDDPLPTPKTLNLIEGWLTAVKAAIREKLDAGEHVPGWKLVEGRKGPRKWANPDGVVDIFKQMRLKLKDVLNQTPKTPTQLEKIVPAKKWEQLQAHITQSEPSVTMVDELDKRPAISQADDFDLV
jgi:hypothetical protein